MRYSGSVGCGEEEAGRGCGCGQEAAAPALLLLMRAWKGAGKRNRQLGVDGRFGLEYIDG